MTLRLSKIENSNFTGLNASERVKSYRCITCSVYSESSKLYSSTGSYLYKKKKIKENSKYYNLFFQKIKFLNHLAVNYISSNENGKS